MNGPSREIRAFIEDHPHGWGHDEWLGFLHQLSHAGYDTSDPDGLGLALEQERVRLALRDSGIKGLGPKRIESIAREFPTLFALQNAGGSEIVHRCGVPGKLAEAVAGLWG